MVKDKLGRGLTDLRISLTDRCNLRCTYCMPKEIFGPDYVFLKKNEWLKFSELNRVVRAFQRLGVRKIRLTGGEPLLRPGIFKYINYLKEDLKVQDLAITTNGTLLKKYAAELSKAGLDRVTVSLDGLKPEVCGQMNGQGIGPDRVLAGIEAAQSAGLSLKVNMVVESGTNDSEILPMATYFKNLGVTLRFIEFMDVGSSNEWNRDRVFTGKEILSRIATKFEVEPVDTSSAGEVARRYRYKDCGNEFGLITSISQPFCTHCSRARISADGQLFTCLFASSGFDLKRLLREESLDDEELFKRLAKIWAVRDDRYSELRSTGKQNSQSSDKVEMSYIGG